MERTYFCDLLVTGRPLTWSLIVYSGAYVVASMGYPANIIGLIKQLYGQQKAAVRTSHGLTGWFTIEQGVHQGCILSPHLFNIYSEQIMRNALDGFVGSVNVGGRTISNLR